MTIKPTEGRSLKRRGFLAALGGTGVGAAVAVFGGATQAGAVTFACCNLAFKNSGNLNYCLSKSHYVWNCGNGGNNYCDCCEVKDSHGNYIRSDAACFEGG